MHDKFKNFPGLAKFTEGGSIPDRYKKMGFTKVGVKKESTRPGKKWMVLAKKDDQYKVIHGGYKGMQDYTQHHNEQRKENFWNRMGGKNSAKAKDPFSPLYWHKKFGTWEQGGEVFNEDSMDFYQQGGQTTLYEFVKAAGYNPSFASRKELLGKYVQGEYTGSAEQNIELLRKLKSGEIQLDGKPTAKPAVKSAPKTTSSSTTTNRVTNQRPSSADSTAARVDSTGVRTDSIFPGAAVSVMPTDVPPVKSTKTTAKKQTPSLPQSIAEDKNVDIRQIPQTGVVVDRGTNQAFVLGDNAAYTFPVLTGRSTDPSATYSDAGIVAKRANANLAVTPTGYFTMDNPFGPNTTAEYDGNIRGIRGIDAYGVPANIVGGNGSRVAIHQTYNPSVRDAYYDMGPEERRASQGCINCRQEDYMLMNSMVAPSDTLLVIDSRNPGDQRLLEAADQRRANYLMSVRNPAFDATSYADATYVAPQVRSFRWGGAPKYQTKGQFPSRGSGMFNAWLEDQKLKDLLPEYQTKPQEQVLPETNTPQPTAMADPYFRNISNTSGMGNIFMQDLQMEDFLNNYGAYTANVEATKEKAITEDTQTTQENAGTSLLGAPYDPLGTKKNPYNLSPFGVAPVAMYPGMIADFNNRGIQNKAAAKSRVGYLTDYKNPVIPQGLSTSRGNYTFNEGILDPTHYTPTEYGNFAQKGGQIVDMDDDLIKELIAAGADIEIIKK